LIVPFFSFPFAQYAWGEATRLSVGDSCSLSKSFNESDVRAFGAASGDYNPVHYPEMYEQHAKEVAARSSSAALAPPSAAFLAAASSIARFPRPLVHGLLTSSLVGTLFASHLPGAIYLSQSLHFRAPVFYDESVTATIHVLSIQRKRSGARVTCRTVVEKAADAQGKPPVVVVEGEATVLVESLVEDNAA
jgi:acyl dehydratase